MNWRRITGIVRSRDGRAGRVSGFLSGAMVLGLVESDDVAPDSVQVSVAIDADSRVAIVADTGPDGITGGPTIVAGPPLEDLVAALVADVHGDATFGEIVEEFHSADAPEPIMGPFEGGFDAGIAYVADRAVVYAGTDLDGVIEFATAVEDTVYARPFGQGYLICVDEGPTMTSLAWPPAVLPAVIFEQGAAFPSITYAPGTVATGAAASAGEEPGSETAGDPPSGEVSGTASDTVAAEPAAGEPAAAEPAAAEPAAELPAQPYLFAWDTRIDAVPDCEGDIAVEVKNFIDTHLGLSVLARDVAAAFPGSDPERIRASFNGPNRGLPALGEALGLPEDLLAYLDNEITLADIDNLQAVAPDTFAHNVRRVVLEASDVMNETAETMRHHAVTVRTRAETAFDAAETFAEEIVLPARASWVSPALAAAETTLGVLALRRARRIGGPGGALLGAGGVLLLGDALVNTIVTLAPLLRRKR